MLEDCRSDGDRDDSHFDICSEEPINLGDEMGRTYMLLLAELSRFSRFDLSCYSRAKIGARLLRLPLRMVNRSAAITVQRIEVESQDHRNAERRV